MADVSNLRELYQEVIIDHNKNPRNFRVLENYTHYSEGVNPLCGDELKLYLFIENHTIKQLSFEGQGCAISTASASLMTEILTHKTVEQAENIFNYFHQSLTLEDAEKNIKNLDKIKNLAKTEKLQTLKGVQEFPSRVKCATLAWHALHAALQQKKALISTE